jgi:ketosteroid isomerase-like protein
MRIVTTHLIAVALLLVTRALATEISPQAQALSEINEQIWRPFVRGVNTFDHPLYSGVRAKDSVFVDGKRLFGYEEYVEDAVRVMTLLQKAGTRLEMEVRFDDRITDGAHAFESGVVRVIAIEEDGARRTSHARFQVISRKQPEGWRIITDHRWRTNDDADTQAFENARSLENLAAFVQS